MNLAVVVVVAVVADPALMLEASMVSLVPVLKMGCRHERMLTRESKLRESRCVLATSTVWGLLK
jgi:hypothetical protein